MSGGQVGQRSLVRLERVVDVIYAIMIWQLFTFLPRLSLDEPPPPDMLAWLASDWEPFVVVPLAMVILVVYWLQSNDMLGRLKGTNGVHASLMIAQLFSVLVFFYAIRTGLSVGDNPWARTMESGTAVLMGAVSLLAWRYSVTKRRLLASDISAEDVDRLSHRYLSEPLTAAITIPFAFVGPYFWELSWFLYPFIRYLLYRRSR